MPNAGSAIGGAIGAAGGGGIGAAAGGWIGNQIGGLFNHQAGASALQSTYNGMSNWVKSLITYDEFAALESNRQAGFFATEVTRDIENKTTLSDLDVYRQWSNAHYKTNVQGLANRLMDAKAEAITLVNSPNNNAAANAAALGGVQTASMIPTFPSLGNKTYILLAIAAVVVLFLFMRKR
jgi:hypothetical protein